MYSLGDDDSRGCNHRFRNIMRMYEIAGALTDATESSPFTANYALHIAHGPRLGERPIDYARTEHHKLGTKAGCYIDQPRLHFGLAAAVVVNRSWGGILVHLPSTIAVHGRGAQ